MSTKAALQKSIEHWERMIRWVEQMPAGKRRKPRKSAEMYDALGERWGGDHCALCAELPDEQEGCEGCVLHEHGYGCDDESRSPYDEVRVAITWCEWLRAARNMLKVLRSLDTERTTQNESSTSYLQRGDERVESHC